MNVIETAVDLEDRLAREFKDFQFMNRETSIVFFLFTIFQFFVLRG